VASGETLFDRADPVTAVHLVQSGELHLIRRHENGASVLLQRARAGDVLAEASILSDSHHCAAVAARDTSLKIVGIVRLRQMLSHDTGLMQSYLAHLAQEVRAARMRAEILSLRTVAERLEAWLVWQDGQLPPRGQWQTLASEIGVSREALYRALAQMRRSGDHGKNRRMQCD